MARSMIIAGNWKLNPICSEGDQLFQQIQGGVTSALGQISQGQLEVLVCPPAPYLGRLSSQHPDALRIGSQDIDVCQLGAFTGALNGEILKSFGVHSTLVGHSERRQLFGETDQSCAAKVAAALQSGVRPVLCVGETEAERDAQETFEVIHRQLSVGLSQLPDSLSDFALPACMPFVIAYEPVWAIGTGKTASPQQAVEVHRYIRNSLQEMGQSRGEGFWGDLQILYGGSVKPSNASELLGESEIDGALIGGASLQAESFLAILEAGIKAQS